MSRRRGFTLVELLVVIGIIVVLIAILLPVISRVRRQANRVVCASNMRQVGIALLMYASENRDHLPAPAEWRVHTSSEFPIPEDWVHWQKGRDIRQSRIWPYLKGNLNVLKCPRGVDRPEGEYPFSYVVNAYITGHDWGNAGRGSWHSGPSWKLSSVRPAAKKLMLIEPNTEQVFHGAWTPGVTEDGPKGRYGVWLSILHDSDSELTEKADGGGRRGVYNTGVEWTLRGNFIFVDGHGEFAPRWKGLYHPYIYPDWNGPVPNPKSFPTE